MYRGQTLFKCTHCGNRFKGPDMEQAATALTVPCKCPKCGSIRTRPTHLFDFGSSDSEYQKIWEDMEKRKL